MKLWIDDVRPAPDGYYWIKSVNFAKQFISTCIFYETHLDLEGSYKIDLIDIDHDAGEYAEDGGDYIELLNWLEVRQINIPIHIHSMNPVGIENMRRIIRRNNWEEVK